MDWCSPLSSGLAVSAGGRLATRAASTIARQVELGKVRERRTHLGGEDVLDFLALLNHRQPRR